MDFELILKRLLEGFDKKGLRYALTGGLALGALGAPRATMDIDFLVHKEDLDALHQIMLALGYTRKLRTDNVSQYRHTAPGLAIDFLHASRPASLGMLERAKKKTISGGTCAVRVLEPEDVIGLKVQAIANDPARKTKDSADIEALMGIHGVQLDWERLAEYYHLFGVDEEFKHLKERFAHAQ